MQDVALTQLHQSAIGMPQTTDPPVSSPALDSALAWLAKPPAEDPLREMVPLRNHLAAFGEMGVAPLQLLKILELFQPRVNAINASLKPLLHQASLPVDHRLRTVSQGLIDIHGAIAAAYAKVMREADSERLKNLHRNPTSLCALALGNLAEQFEVSLMIAAPAPLEMWRNAQAIHHWLMGIVPHDSTLPAGATASLHHFKVLVAIAAGQPESFTPPELDFLMAYLREFGSQVELSVVAPKQADDTWYWINDNRDQPPCALVRRTAPEAGRTIWLSCGELGHTALEQIKLLGSGGEPGALGLDSRASNPALRQALRRAAERWMTPPKRNMTRRGRNVRVRVCTDLGALWLHQRGDSHDVADAVGITTTDWMMLNESPGGLAIMHVSGNTHGLAAGSALAVQPAAQQPWALCLVRWARSENPEHIELGLELVAPATEAVRLISHGSNRQDRAGVEGFRLPPLPAADRGEAIMCRPGLHQGGAFTLVSEDQQRIQLSECAPGALIVQTTSIELFQFTRDFSPAAP